MSSATAHTVKQDHPAWITLLLATACGIIVANLYYAQPLVGPISAATGLSAQAAGLIVTLTQIGYGLGLLFIVPMGDIVENRRLVVIGLFATAIALVAAALAKSAVPFLAASFLVGLGSVGAQVLVPFAAHLAPEAARGRAVGNVMSGLLLGIMLARPVSSMVADLFGWHAIFGISAVATFVLALVLARVLPRRQPTANTHYFDLLGSMWHLLKKTSLLRRRASYHACAFGAFSLFWTTVPLRLSEQFHLSQKEIALFALVGVSGALAAPLAGRLADRGWTKQGTRIALATMAISFLLPLMFPSDSLAALIILAVAAILLDMGVSANHVLSQRAIFALGAEVRSRLNGLYMAIFFAGGAAGSAIGGWAYASYGWSAALLVGLALPIVAMLYFATE